MIIIIIEKKKDHSHHLTKYEGKGKKSHFLNFLVNWGKFGSAI